MNKEQNMTNRISTNLVWYQLETSGKAIVSTVLNGIDGFISRLHDEARDYGVSLSIKHSDSQDGRLYIYLRKNRS